MSGKFFLFVLKKAYLCTTFLNTIKLKSLAFFIFVFGNQKINLNIFKHFILAKCEAIYHLITLEILLKINSNIDSDCNTFILNKKIKFISKPNLKTPHDLG